MKVRQLLQRKDNNAIESVSVGTKIAEAATRLSERKIGCVLVLASDGGIDGIVSERDIVRALGQAGGACLDDTVDSIMTKGVITCAPTDDDNSILGKMTTGRFRHIPVVDEGKLVGLISIGDVVKARIDSLESENQELENLIRAATA